MPFLSIAQDSLSTYISLPFALFRRLKKQIIY